MICPSCRKTIAAESVFCMFCGVRLSRVRLANQLVQIRNPISIGQVDVYFDGKVKLVSAGRRLKHPHITRDTLWVDFQLFDNRGAPVACNGIADLNIKVIQMKKGQPLSSKVLLKTKTSLKLKAALFQHDEKGQPYYHQLYPAPFSIQGQGYLHPSCDVGIKVIPEGGKEPLYQQTEVSADPEAWTNRVIHMVEEGPDSPEGVPIPSVPAQKILD